MLTGLSAALNELGVKTTKIDSVRTKPLNEPYIQKGSEAQVEDSQDIAKALEAVNKQTEPLGVSLKFHQDDATGALVVELVDQKSGDTIRQIPDDVKLRLAAALGKMQGLVVDRRV